MTSFSDLVKEAFIDPLRSVLIVDDEYPTWEEILNSHLEVADQDPALESASQRKSWRTNASDPLKVIKEFRSRKPGFVIDIHDALAPPANDHLETPNQLADHLHQSDLLVLDYNLEGGTGLRGEKAQSILRSVLSNQHFNLIIVHTGEHDLDEVMSQCIISLMQSCTSQFDKNMQNEVNQLDDELTELEAVGEFDRSGISENLSVHDYLEIRKSSQFDLVRQYMRGEGHAARLHDWGRRTGLSGKDLKNFLFWSIKHFESKILTNFLDEPIKGLVWSFGDNSKWLRTSKGFVTFVKKGPYNLIEKLQNALEDWKPTPSRLISAKYRCELNRIGVEAEDESLLKNHMHALVYQNIRNSIPQSAPSDNAHLLETLKLKEHVWRQSESLSFLIEDKIVEFGHKIIDVDEAAGNQFSSHYQVNLSDKDTERTAIAQYNNYVSTLPRKALSEKEQLDSGHIFKISNEWWVCATPACDLQPGQNSIAFMGTSANLKPFTALKLEKVNVDELESDHINSGSYCFVEEDGKIVGLGLRSLAKEKEPGTQKVTWRTFIAKKGGLIENRALELLQLKLNESDIGQQPVQATIIAKLRYEYALNFIQRVGVSVSRIGLNYTTP